MTKCSEKFRMASGASSFAAVCVASLLASPAVPATIVVDAVCTLPDAVAAANADQPVGACPAGSGDDVLVLAGDVAVDLPLPGTDNAVPEIVSTIVIEGGSHTLSRVGSDLFRFFGVAAGGRLTVRDLRLEGGAVDGSGGAVRVKEGSLVLDGCELVGNAAVESGGAVFALGLGSRVEVHRSTLSHNVASENGGAVALLEAELEAEDSVFSSNEAGAHGGALSILASAAAEGTSVLRRVEVLDNHAVALGGGLSIFGDALTIVKISDSTFERNSALGGGGLAAFSVTVEMETTILRENRSATEGGGLAALGDAGRFFLARSLVAENEAVEDGGGLFVAEGLLGIVNSTISGNRRGGLVVADPETLVVVFGASFVGNETYNYGTALREFAPDPAVQVEASLFVHDPDEPAAVNCAGRPFLDLGGNLADDLTCSTVPDGLTGVELRLADNGGPTPTHALSGTSTAIDAAGACALETDQRGGVRPPGFCDSGAYELDQRPCFPLVRSHTGAGADPLTSPLASLDCNPGEYHQDERVELSAAPEAGWEVGGWTGTGDDGSTSPSNTLSMPGSQHAVSVQYVQSCFALTVGHTGTGSSPSATPSSSSGCMTGEYHAGEAIQLGAVPAAGWHVTGWSGTAADTSTSTSNSLVMPAQGHAVLVSYAPSCFPLSVSSSGMGSAPSLSPASSSGCGAGAFNVGERVALAAAPAPGWVVNGWTGTEADGSVERENALTMPAGPHQVSVAYVELLFGDGFESGNTEAWTFVSP